MISLQRSSFMPPFSCQFTPEAMRDRTALKPLTLVAALMLALASVAFPARAQDANAAKARALVDAAIKMTDSDGAVKLLWQATEIDPTLDDAYIYLGLYYNSRSDFTNVDQGLSKAHQVSAQPGQRLSEYRRGVHVVFPAPDRRRAGLLSQGVRSSIPRTLSPRSELANCWRRSANATRRSSI